MLYHNQKVLGMDFYEEKVEYFGKTGVSLIGSMEVQYEEISNGSQSQGFSYSFFDYVIKGYSG